MTQIVFNAEYGGYGLSEEAQKRFEQLGGIGNIHYAKRSDPILVQVVDELGVRANGRYAELAIAEVPEGLPWCTTEYDGKESVEVDVEGLLYEAIMALRQERAGWQNLVDCAIDAYESDIRPIVRSPIGE